MKIECIIDDETKDVVAKLTEQKNKQIARYNENNEEKKERVTLADMCGELITTGAFRRKAANRWHAPKLGKCTQCGAVLKSHTACPACGTYRGRQVLNVEV